MNKKTELDSLSDSELISVLAQINPMCEIVFGFCAGSPLTLDLKGKDEQIKKEMQKSYEEMFGVKRDFTDYIEKFLSCSKAYYYCFGVVMSGDDIVDNKCAVYFQPISIFASETYNQDAQCWIANNEDEILNSISAISSGFNPEKHEKAIFNSYAAIRSGTFTDCFTTMKMWSDLHLRNCLAEAASDVKTHSMAIKLKDEMTDEMLKNEEKIMARTKKTAKNNKTKKSSEKVLDKKGKSSKKSKAKKQV